MSGAEMIAAERQRQIDAEGWTPEHDVECHGSGELLNSAIGYALASHPGFGIAIAASWASGGPCAFKPGDPIRNLAKAGALIAAEIDRLKAQPS